MGFDCWTFTGLGKQALGEHKLNFACTRSQEKGAVSPQETESNLPVSVHESPVEVWINSSASGQTRGREHSPTHQQKIGLNIYWVCRPLQNKTQFPPQSVSPITFPEASYPYSSEGRQNENPNHRKLTSLITWTTALSISMKLWAMPCRATQDGWVIVESSDKKWSTGERNGKPLQYSSLENPMNSIKRQKDMTLKDELPRSVAAQYATERSGEINPERMKRQSQSENSTQLWMWLRWK